MMGRGNPKNANEIRLSPNSCRNMNSKSFLSCLGAPTRWVTTMTKADPPNAKGTPTKGDIPAATPKLNRRSPANDAGEIVSTGPYHAADLNRWAKLLCWNAVEAACVTCGYEPSPLQTATREELEIDPVTLSKIEYRVALFERAMQIGMIGDPMLPMEALKVLEDREEEFPGLLYEVASRIRPFGKPVRLKAGAIGDVVQAIDELKDDATVATRFSSKSAQTKVITTLQKMLLGVVIQKFDFDPDRPQNPTAKLVLQAMADAGLPLVDVDTVRDHLRYCVEEHWEGKLK